MLLAFLILFQNCKKEENFTYCTDCALETWVGDYSGSGAYFDASNGNTSDTEVEISIENPYNDLLEIHVKAEQYLSEKYTTSKDDTQHYITINSGAKSLDLSLYQKDLEYKLNGTLKHNHWNNKDSVWVMDRSLTFSVNKQ